MEAHKVFSYLSGIIIISRDPSISGDLSQNVQWREYSHTHPTIARVFFSHDLLDPIQRDGLPKQVQKYLYTNTN